MNLRPTGSLRGPPLALQIMALLLGVLVAAQLATLLLTLLLPPSHTAQYELDDVAEMLIGGDADKDDQRTLVRTEQAGPPDISGPGWLNAETSRGELARMIGTSPRRVILAFYSPLPFAGTATPRAYAMADDGPVAPLGRPAGLFRRTALVQMEGAAVQMEGRRFGADIGMGGGGMRPPPHDGFPPGFVPGGGRFGEGAGVRGGGARLTVPGGSDRNDPLVRVEGAGIAGREAIVGDGGAAVPQLLRGAAPPAPAAAATLSNRVLAQQPLAPQPGSPAGAELPPPLLPRAPLPQLGLPDRTLLSPPPAANRQAAPAGPPVVTLPAPRAQPPVPQSRSVPLAPPAVVPPLLAPAPTSGEIRSAPNQVEAPPAATPAGPPIRVSAVPRGLFGLAPAPFVVGDFVAALRLPNGRWAVVQPAPEPFPNSWQRRVLLWFALSLTLVAPVGWLFSRRLVKPLEGFASAAEALGRDPAASIGPLDGPAEIGRAARAFNLMQTRLRTFVDDRTAMIGAISHDLRTPLTRMRFRIEDAPDDLRDGLLEEVEDMEAMIAEVIAFLRNASAPSARERCDLNLLVEDVVENARMVGADVTIEHSEAAPVEVDVLGMRRLLDNLLENAVKYGERARIRVSTELDSVVAQVIDAGPGLPEDEMERVFEPFYRSEAARASDKPGTGLGLAVCRSIARAHGGDVRLVNADDGFRAEIRVPLAYGTA